MGGRKESRKISARRGFVEPRQRRAGFDKAANESGGVGDVGDVEARRVDA
jgi:hypothetical protein